MHEEPVFDIAWCCQPHRMGYGQHLNLNMDMKMDGSFINAPSKHFHVSHIKYPIQHRTQISNHSEPVLLQNGNLSIATIDVIFDQW